jgi:SAM-dependent methyltransferase
VSASGCPLCARPDCPRRWAIAGCTLRACPDCRLEFLDPQPEESVLAAIYREGYFLGEDEPRSRMKSATGALYIDALAGIVDPKNAALLEIGCGHGEVLWEARRRGFHVAGVEISPHAAAAANQRLGESVVHAGSLDTTPFPAGSFDAVLAADVIEHVRDPQAFLTRVQELLRPRGVLLLITPSLDSWTRRLMGRRWMEYKLEHLFYFSPVSMRRLLERCGFSEILIRPNRKVLTLDYIARHFDRFRVPVLSPLMGLVRGAIPDSLAHRQVPLPAGGIAILARKIPTGRPKCSIIVAAFNEAKTFPILMDALLKKQIAGMDREIIIIESNSSDSTRAQAQQYQSHPDVKLVLQDRARGKGHAIREGFRHATGDVVLIQDADLEYDLDDYDALLQPILSARASFVLGTRHAGDWKIRKFAQQRSLSAALNFGHAFFTGLINLLYRQSMTDPFTMFKVFRRDCLYGLEFHCNRFDFDHELVIKLVRKGYRPLDVPVNYCSRSFRDGKKVRLFRDPLTWLWVDLKLRFTK